MRDVERRNIITELLDAIMFTFYIIILYFVMLENKDTLTIQSKKEIEDLINGVHTRTKLFTDIEHFSE